MKIPRSPLFLTLLPLAALLAAPANSTAQSPRALRLYESLEKRPESTPLFEQFHQAWLEEGTLEEMEQFLKPNPAPAAQTVLAQLYARRGDVEKASELLAGIMKKSPQPESCLLLARWRLQTQAFDAALMAVETGLAASPGEGTRRKLMEFKGRALAKARRLPEARAVWESLLKDHPDDADLQEELVDLLVECGAVADAVKTARGLAAATTDPYRRVLRRIRSGELEALQGREDEAVAEYRAALEDTGAGSWLERDLLRQIETTFRRGDRVRVLVEFLAKLAGEHPQRLHVRRRLAELLADQGNPAEAEKTWLALLAAAPGDRTLAEAYIQSLTATDRHAEAAAQWRTLIAQHPQEAALHLQLAAALHAAKDEPGCEAEVRAYFNAAGATEEAAVRSAAELSRMKLAGAALVFLSDSLTSFPASSVLRLQYAAALHSADRHAEARAEWRAESARPGQLLPVARAALALGEAAFAWELLEPRAAEVQQDAGGLSILCEAAQRAEKWAQGLAFARRLADIAPDVPAMTDALAIAMRCADRGKLRDSLLEELNTRRGSLNIKEKCLLAELMDGDKSRAKKLALLEEVTAAEPASGLAMLVRVHSAAGQWAEAVKAQRRLVEAGGSRNAAQVQRLVDLCVSAGDLKEALKWAREWKQMAPGTSAPWLRLAAIHSQMHRADDAVRELTQATLLWPDDTAAGAKLAEAYQQAARPMAAAKAWLRLMEREESPQQKQKWLRSLTTAAQGDHRTQQFLQAEFEDRRQNNRQSPVPLMALAELAVIQGQMEKAAGFLRDAARLGKGDAALLMQAAEMAAASGQADLAESLLIEAGEKDATGASVLQRAALLLRVGKEKQAGDLLISIINTLPLEQAAQASAELHRAGHTWTASVIASLTSARAPENYRLSFLAAWLTWQAGDSEAALAAFLRLVKTPYAPMPMPPAPAAGLMWQPTGTLDPSSLLPETPVGDERGAMLSSLFTQLGENDYSFNPWGGSWGSGNVRAGVRIPGPVYELRAMSAAAAIRIAAGDEASVMQVKASLLASGIRAALFAEVLAGMESNPNEPKSWQDHVLENLPDLDPQDRDWVIRNFTGENAAPVAADSPLLSFVYQPYWPHPSKDISLAAWLHFRDSQPELAVASGLQLIGVEEEGFADAAGQAVERLRTVNWTPQIRQALTNLLARMQTDRRGLMEPVRQAVIARFQALPDGPERLDFRPLMRAALAAGSDAAAIAGFVEEDMVLIAGGKISVTPQRLPVQHGMWNGFGSWGGWGGWRGMGHLPAAQPVQLMPLSPSLAQSTGGTNYLEPRFTAVTQGTGSAVVSAAGLMPYGWLTDKEKVRAVFRASTVPALRCYLAASAGDDALLAEAMEKLGAAPEAPGDLILRAAWAWRQRDAGGAVALLARAAEAQPDSVADAVLASAAVLLLWDSQPVTEEMKRSIRPALQRLAAKPDSWQNRSTAYSIAKALDEEALAGEIEALPPVVAGAPVQPQVTPPAPTPLGAMLNSSGSLANRSGQVLQVPAAIASQLISAQVAGIRNPGTHNHPLNRVQSLISGIPQEQREKVAAELEKQTAPLTGDAGLLAAAELMLQLAPNRALPQVKAALKGVTRLRSNTVSLVSRCLTVMPDAADELLALMPAEYRVSVCESLLSSGVKAYAPRLLAALREMPVGKYPSDNRFLQSLGVIETAEGIEPDFVIALCREILRITRNAKELLPRLAAYDPEDYARREDRRALLVKAAEQSQYEFLPQESRSLPQKCPMVVELIIREAMKDPAWLEAEVEPAISAAGYAPRAAALRAVCPLLTCPPEEFGALAQKIMNRTEAPDADLAALPLLIARERGLTGELPALLVPLAWNPPSSFILEAAAVEGKRGGAEAVNAWLRKMAGEPQPKDIWLRPSNPVASSGAGMARLVTMSSTLSQLPSQQEAVRRGFQFIRLIKPLTDSIPGGSGFSSMSIPRFPDRGAPAQAVVDYLLHAGFLDELPEAAASMSPAMGGEQVRSSLFNFVQYLSYREDSDELLGLLEKERAATFGGRIAAAIVREARVNKSSKTNQQAPAKPEENGRGAVMGVLTAELDRIKALPEDTQLQLLPLALAHWQMAPAQDEAARDYFRGLNERQLRLRFEKLSALSDHELRAYPDVTGELRQVCPGVFVSAPDKVIALLRRVAAVVKMPASPPGQPYPLQDVMNALFYRQNSTEGRTEAGLLLRSALYMMQLPPEPWMQEQKEWAGAAVTQMRTLLGNGDNNVTMDSVLNGAQSLSSGTFTAEERRLLLPLMAAELLPHVLSQSDGAAPYLAKINAAGPPQGIMEVAALSFEMGVLRRDYQQAQIAAKKNFLAETGREGSVPDVLPVRGIAAVENLPPPVRRLYDLANDAALPALLRLKLLAPVLNISPELFHPVLLTTLVALLQEGGGDERELYGLSRNLARAALLWQDGLSAEQLKVILHAVLGGDYGSSGLPVEFLQLALQTGDDGVISSMLSAVTPEDDAVQARYRAFCVLFHSEQMARAAALVPARPAEPGSRAEAQMKHFSPASAKSIAGAALTPAAYARRGEFLKLLPESGSRLMASVMIAAMPDSPEMARSEHPRRKRMKEAVAAVLEEKLSGEWLRELAPWMKSDEEAWKTFSAAMSEAVRKMPLRERLKDYEGEAQFQKEMAGYFEAGNIEAIAAQIEALLALPDDEGEVNAAHYLRHLRIAMNKAKDWTPARQALVRRLLRLSALYSWADPQPGAAIQEMGLCLAVHAAANDLPELEKAIAAAGHVPALDEPETAEQALRFFHDPAPMRLRGGSPLALPGQLAGQREDGLVRLAGAPALLRGTRPGMVVDFLEDEKQNAGAEACGALRDKLLPLLAPLVSKENASPAETAVLVDLGILAAEAGRKDEALQCLARAETALKAAPPERWTALLHGVFLLRRALHGPEEALAFVITQNEPGAPAAGDSRSFERLGLAMNLTDAALLKSLGPEKWRALAEKRLTPVPDTTVAALHVAFVLEKLAGIAAAAGEKSRALDLMSLSIMAADNFALRNRSALTASDRELFTANWAFHALSAGEKITFKELLSPGGKWEYAVTAFRPPEGRKREKYGTTGASPVGWKSPAAVTVVEPYVNTWLLLRAQFDAGASPRAEDRPGILYCVQCDWAEDIKGFMLNESYLTWSDSGRPELAPSLAEMASDKVKAAKSAPARITMLGPQWLQQGANSLEMVVPVTPRVDKAYAFDAALYALELTFDKALKAARGRQLQAESIPGFWSTLPQWLRE